MYKLALDTNAGFWKFGKIGSPCALGLQDLGCIGWPKPIEGRKTDQITVENWLIDRHPLKIQPEILK
jgi:hypothetical protein